MVRLWISMALFVAAVLAAAALAPDRVQAGPLCFESVRHTYAPGRTQRVQADLARTITTWSGSTACDTPQRARDALKPGIARWLGGQMVARPGRKLAQWGYHSGDVWVENRTVNGKRRCIAGFRKLIAYADFR